MTKQQTPFWDMDVTKAMADFKVPAIDMEALMTAHRKNVEAMNAANNLAVEGMQAVARRQIEIMRTGMEEMTAMVGDLMKATSPEERIAKQADLTKTSFEKTLANMKELSELIAKSNSEATEVINKRIAGMLDEMKTLAKTAGKK